MASTPNTNANVDVGRFKVGGYAFAAPLTAPPPPPPPARGPAAGGGTPSSPFSGGGCGCRTNIGTPHQKPRK